MKDGWKRSHTFNKKVVYSLQKSLFSGGDFYIDFLDDPSCIYRVSHYRFNSMRGDWEFASEEDAKHFVEIKIITEGLK